MAKIVRLQHRNFLVGLNNAAEANVFVMLKKTTMCQILQMIDD